MDTKTESPATDISICNCGTIFLFRPMNDAAKAHLEARCGDAQWFSDALVCEHRYARGLAEHLKSDGLTVE